MEIELQKFKIKIDSYRKPNIELNDDILPPKLLYKYYSLNNNSLTSLSNITLHFSHMYNMNDVMDGNFLIWEIDNFIEKYIPSISTKNFKDKISFLLALSDDFLKYIGTFCLCEINNNDLLWSHYTSETGYCLELDIESIIQQIEEKGLEYYFFPINYGEIKTIDLLEYSVEMDTGQSINVDINLPILYCLSNKEKFWEYEKEWRLVIRNNKFEHYSNSQFFITQDQKKIEKKNLQLRNICFNNNIIKKVILSPVFFNNKRFLKSEFKNIITKYYFIKEDEEYDTLYKFFKELKQNYTHLIYQMDKIIENGKIIRKAIYKIGIIEFNEDYIEIARLDLRNIR